MPVLRQDVSDLPAEVLEQARPHQVLLQDVGVIVKGVGVDEDSQPVRRVAGAVDSQIASQTRLADLAIDLVAVPGESARELSGDRVTFDGSGRGGVIRSGGETRQ